jgi:hypothetical protein
MNQKSKKVNREPYRLISEVVIEALFTSDKKRTFDVTVGDVTSITDKIYYRLRKRKRLP